MGTHAAIETAGEKTGVDDPLEGEPNLVDQPRSEKQWVWVAARAIMLVWTARDLFNHCAQPLYLGLRNNNLRDRTWENCKHDIASAAASSMIGLGLKSVGVTRVRDAVKSALGRAVTWSSLRTALNKKNYRDAASVAADLIGQFLTRVVRELEKVMRQYSVPYSVSG